MGQKTYLTVAEYAQIKGISKQRVYQLLNKGLKEFVQEVEGRKVIDIRALSENEVKRVEQEFQGDLNKFEQGVEQEVKPPNSTKFDNSSTELDIIRQVLADYKEQLEAKDRQIEAKDKQIDELTRLLSQSQELNRNNQLLLAQKTAEQPPQTEAEPEAEIIAPPAEPPKRGFWARLFGI